MGDDSAGYGGEAGGRETGEPRRQWWDMKWAGDNAGCGGERCGFVVAGDGEEIRR